MYGRYTQIRNRLLTPTAASKTHLGYIFLVIGLASFPLAADELNLPPISFDCFMLGVLAISVFLPEKLRPSLWITGAFATICIVIRLGDPLDVVQTSYHLRMISTTLFFATLLRVFILEITFGQISLKMVYQSVSSYILIGLIFARLFRIIQMQEPESFNFPVTEEFNHVYISFIVLTSVGLGDLLPQTMAAKSVIIVEAVIGQIYLAFFVSIIIGKYMTRNITGGSGQVPT